MSTESDQIPQGTDTDNTPQGEQTQQAAPQGEVPESQDSTDWKAMARKWQQRAERSDKAAKDLEAKVKGLLTPEEVQTKEQALAEAQRQAQEAANEALRYKVALAEGLPVELAERLRGADEDQLREDAKTLKAMVKTASPAADAKKGTMAATPATPQDPNDLLRQIIASR